MKQTWIWLNRPLSEDTYGEFRIPLQAKGKPLFLELSAHTDYAVYWNDQFVYAGQYADMPWYKIKDRIPLPISQKEENILTILVYYGGDMNFHRKIGKPMLWFSLDDGKEVLVTSSAATLSRLAPRFCSGRKKTITRQLGYSFALDPNLSGEEFTPSKVVEGPQKLFLRPNERLIYETPREMDAIGNQVYDAKEESFGVPYLKAKIPFGEKVTIAFGEWLDEKGHVAQHIGPRDFSFELIGNGKETLYTNPFAKYGFRYWEIKGQGEFSFVGWIPVHYPFVLEEHSFSSPKRQKIYDVGVRTLRLNAMDHYFDCPWREQGFYALDSRLQMRYGFFAFQGQEYQKAALQLMSLDRSPKGLISITVPTDDPEVIPSFALYYIIAMEEYAAYSRDTTLLAKYRSKMQGILEQTWKQKRNDGLLENFPEPTYWNFYEWNPGLDGWPAGGKVDACLNFTALFALQHFIQALRLLHQDTMVYERQEKELKQAIHQAFWDDKRKLYRTYITGGYHALINAYALLTDTANQEEITSVSEALVNPPSDMVPCTLSMLAEEYDALLHVDKTKYRDFVLHDIDTKFSMMLERGATSFWETLKGKDDFDGAGSLCHGWSALPVYYYVLLKA